MVVVQPQHFQAFKLSDEWRHFLQTVVVQQELAHRAVRSNKRGSVRAAVAELVVGQLEGLQARTQVAEGEGRDVKDVVVSQGQLTEAAGQICGDGGELVGGQVQRFQRPERRRSGLRNFPLSKASPDSCGKIVASRKNSTASDYRL